MIYKWDVPSIQCEELWYAVFIVTLTISDITANLIFWLTLSTYVYLNSTFIYSYELISRVKIYCTKLLRLSTYCLKFSRIDSALSLLVVCHPKAGILGLFWNNLRSLPWKFSAIRPHQIYWAKKAETVTNWRSASCSDASSLLDNWMIKWP
jgi:hypothetical protein